MAAKQPEDKVKKAIKEVINDLFPVNYTLMVVPNGFGRAGIPDILSCVPVTITEEMVGRTFGMLVGVEAKVEGNTPTKLQLINLAEIIAAGGYATEVIGVDQAERLRSDLEKFFCLTSKSL